MKTKDVVVVRIYVTESSHLLKQIITYLKKETQIQGFSVFRAIEGFGAIGEHSTSLLDLFFDLPLTIEFFDEKNRVEPVIEYLNKVIKPAHIIFWEAKANIR
jgi:uncharacterized protein